MNNNVVIAVFEVESEAFQAFNDLCRASAGEGYAVAEAALIKNKDNKIDVLDGFGAAPAGSDTSAGIIIGSLVGLLGGPIGVIIGAAAGAWIGSASDTGRALDSASVVAVVASKLYEGEIAIAALVSEDEPAFDAVFANYKTTIVRYDAADIADDVDRLYELEANINDQVVRELKEERKEERAEKREARREDIKTKMENQAKADEETSKIMSDLRPV